MSDYLRSCIPLFEEADRLLGEYRPGKYERLVQRVEKQERAAERSDRQAVAKDAAAAKYQEQAQQREAKPDPRPLCVVLSPVPVARARRSVYQAATGAGCTGGYRLDRRAKRDVRL